VHLLVVKFQEFTLANGKEKQRGMMRKYGLRNDE
jgi:hypothetical protein